MLVYTRVNGESWDSHVEDSKNHKTWYYSAAHWHI